MRQNVMKLLAGAVCLVILASAAPAKALMIAAAPIPERVATASTIVVGKVVSGEDKLVMAVPAKGVTDKVSWQVMTVQIEENLLGAKGMKEIRVGYMPPVTGGGSNTGIRPGRRPTTVLTVDQEVCLFLVKHPDENFYVPENYFSVIDKKTPNADKEIETVRHCQKLLNDPMAGLKAKDVEDRVLTAGMLIVRYRTDLSGKGQTAAVDAEESKLILNALAEADWSPQTKNPMLFGFSMAPQALFTRLGLTAQDGWTQPKNFQQIPEAAKKWLKDNAEKYRIQKFVAAKDK